MQRCFHGEASHTVAMIATQRIRRLLTLFLGGMAAIHAGLLWNARDKLRAGYQDFTTFYTAGRIVSQHDAARLYDPDLQYAIQQDFAPRVDIRRGPLPYMHPPLEALIFVPLVKLPFWNAYLIWVAINVLALAGAMLILLRQLPHLREQSRVLWLLSALAFFPVYVAVLQGQDVLLLVLVFVLVHSSMMRKGDFAAGCWLGLGMFRFQLVLPFVAVLLLRRAWRAISGFGLITALFAAGSVALMGWKHAKDYPAFLIHLESAAHGPVNPRTMPNLHGLVDTFSRALVTGVWHAPIIVFLSSALLWYSSVLWRKAADRNQLALSFSMATIAMIISSYHAFEHDLSLLILPVLQLADYHLRHPDRRHWAIFVPIALLFISPVHLLLIKSNAVSLLAIVLLFWFGGIAGQISRVSGSAN